MIPYEERQKMLGKKVTAIGCCGMKDGVKVDGVLSQLSPYALVQVEQSNGHFMPCEVNEHTLELSL